MKLLFGCFLISQGILPSLACDDHGYHLRSENALANRGLQQLDDFSCGVDPATMEDMIETGQVVDAYRKARQAGRVAASTFTIPVTIHVIRNSNGDGDATDAKLQDYISGMNSNFQGSAFTFVIKNTKRYQDDAFYNCDKTILNSQNFGSNREGSATELNIYFCNLTDAYGRASLPTPYVVGKADDGVTIKTSGASSWLLTHETGHWLGLYHTFQGGCDETEYTVSSWPDGYQKVVGDGVSDTPAHTQYASGCDATQDSCPTLPGNDPLHNFLNYGSFCGDTSQGFTDGQRERMEALFIANRCFDDCSAVDGTGGTGGSNGNTGSDGNDGGDGNDGSDGNGGGDGTDKDTDDNDQCRGYFLFGSAARGCGGSK